MLAFVFISNTFVVNILYKLFDHLSLNINVIYLKIYYFMYLKYNNIYIQYGKKKKKMFTNEIKYLSIQIIKLILQNCLLCFLCYKELLQII